MNIQKAEGLPVPNGVREDVWRKLAVEQDGRWVIAERSAEGEVVGYAHREADGSKGFAPGGSRGLIVDWPLDAYAGWFESSPIFVCEGASDTASLLSLGLDAVGVPMAGACAKPLAELLSGRHAVVVCDADAAGERGARKIVEALGAVCASVRVILPPAGSKDAREFVASGATREDFERLAAESVSVFRPGDTPQGSGAGPNRNATETPFFSWVSVDELGPSQPPEWVWPGYLARGAITLLTGLWKAGKTTLVLHLLRDLYRGTGLVDTAIASPVLIVSEEGPEVWARRREELGLCGQIHYLCRDTFARLTKEQWGPLMANIAATTRKLGAHLVIIDTLANLWPVESENDAAQVLDCLAPMRDITEEGAALLILHHPRKGEAGCSGFTAARGSGALPAFADVLVELRRTDATNPEDRRRTLNAVGRHEGIPASRVFELTDEGYVPAEDEGGVGAAMPDDGQTILSLIDAGVETSDEMRAHWPTPRIGRGRLLGVLSQGLQGGRWTRTGEGVRGNPWRYRRAGAPASEPGAVVLEPVEEEV